jgi:BASS family bile acid:Na+ symporter
VILALENLDRLQINFDSDSLWLANVTLALVMFGIALDIKVSDFTTLLKSPKPVIVGIIAQFFLIPFVTFILVSVINPLPSIALGMIMVASCPGGNVSNFMSKLAGGNTALSISLTAFASFAALIMTPLNFAIYGNLYEPTSEILRSVSLSPLEIAKIVGIIIGIPLLLGMTIKHYYSNFASRASKVLKPVSILIFVAFVAVALYENLDIFRDYISNVLYLVLLHNAILILLGFYSAKITGLDYNDQKTLGIEIGIQNSGLGLLLVFSFFDGLGGMALLVAFWAIWDIVSGLIISYYWARKLPKVVAS